MPCHLLSNNKLHWNISAHSFYHCILPTQDKLPARSLYFLFFLKEAYVRTLVQVEGVNAVQFTIKGKPEKDRNGNPPLLEPLLVFAASLPTSLLFHSQAVHILADESGENLIKENVNVRYNSNLPLERVVIEQLQKGPTEEKNKRTLPADMKIIGVSVRDLLHNMFSGQNCQDWAHFHTA